MLEARRRGRTRDLLDSGSGTNRSLGEKILELRDQYHQELPVLCYGAECLQAWLPTYDSRSEASRESFCVCRKHMKAHRRASVSSHLRWSWIYILGLVNVKWGPTL